ncbi:MAG TPA: 2OG-Fe(II) oxygenase [Sphingomonadaceae bacterium]
MLAPGESSPEILRAREGMRRLPSPKLDLFTLPGLVSPELCVELMRLIDINRRPSTLADTNGDHYFRTSETCDLSPDEPAVQALERLLFDLNGIDPAHGEPIQGQRYEVGQEFKAHTDYFEPHGPDFEKYCSVAGQRTWTFMVYLNTVEAGGATRFKVANKLFQPEQGRLVCWNNRRPDGSGNAATLHHAMKVRKGLKYVITKWYRERPWGWADA